MKHVLFAIAMLWSAITFAQTVVTGKVTDALGDPIPGASIKVVGKDLGTTTDFDGNFTLKVSENPPFTLEISSVGHKSTTTQVTKKEQVANFTLQEDVQTLDEIVVSASRTPERIKESPVTIERIDAKIIQNSANADFYEGLENLKGVDINTNSLTFKSINTRGFATFSNARFMQLVDGMDNASPALNFVLGNLLGMNELDVNSVEILPGASSALYGANAFNGILFMTSKSPFDDQGISTYFKTGLTMQEVAGDNNFYDTGIRMAYKFSDKFAGKANFSFMKGTDWMAADYDQYKDVNTGEPNVITPYADRGLSFDGLNIYGDEVATNIYGVAQAMEAGGIIPAGSSSLIPNISVGRTGYKERDLTDYEAKSIKADFALHYKPWANDKEFIFNYKTGKGNTIYQGGNRYYLKDFTLNQVKLEFKGKNFFIRGYRTSEDAGNSYDIRFAGINMNKLNAPQWFGTYVGAILQGKSSIIQQVMLGGGTYAQGVAAAQAAEPQLHAGARAYADQTVTPQPGTAAFNTLFNTVVNDPNLLTGAKFVDRSKMNHADANYNLKDVIDNWADLQIGGSYRLYSLNSEGTIFTDYDGPINYNEYGAYLQLGKKFADDRLKFTGSVRYDKAQNFEGSFSPRVAFVYSAGENKDHNFRASFQTGFRNPTTQDQYIGLDLGKGILVGSAPDNLNRYTSKPLTISSSPSPYMPVPYGTQLGYTQGIQLSGARAYDNAFSLSSVKDALTAYLNNPSDLNGALALIKKSDVDYVKPEGVKAAELGYRGKIASINIDLSGYYNIYEGFIATKTVIVPKYGEIGNANNHAIYALLNSVDPNSPDIIVQNDIQFFQVYTNSKADISSYGATLGVSTKLNKFDVGVNYTYAKFNFDQASDPDYEAGFNTPEHKVKVSLGSEDLFKNFGFGINYRYQTEYLWQATFADAMVPARSVFDAQINYKVPSIKSEFKVGGSNIGGKDYIVAPGTGMIGSQYFISWTINQ